MRNFVAVLIVLASANVLADSEALVVALNREATIVSASLTVAADYVVLPISISSDEKDPIRNLDAVAAARARLTEVIGKQTTIKLRNGVVALRSSDTEDSFSYSKSGYPSANAYFYLVYPLGKRSQFQAVREMVGLLRSVSKPDDARIRLGTATLGLDDPERYRPELLALIAKDIERTKIALKGARSFEVRGLEQRVTVMVYDETNVYVYLPYTLSIAH
jgi:hypothetical protein